MNNIPKSPSVVILSGELSGDRYGSLLARALRKSDPDITLTGLGGDRMQSAGVMLMDHIRNFSAMGFFEVAQKLFQFRSLKNRVVDALQSDPPDALILIDFPDFNLRVAKEMHYWKKTNRSGRPKIFYYIPPQVWIWRKKRIRSIQEYCDAVFPIFRFEHELFLKNNVASFFAGHPIQDFFGESQYEQKTAQNQESALRVGLFPGSRPQEVKKILPIMLSSLIAFQHVSSKTLAVHIGTCETVSDAVYRAIVHPWAKRFTIEFNSATHVVIQSADLILSKPGTVNLEISHFQKPAIIVYKTSWLSWIIAKLWIRLEYVSLINILSRKSVVKEYIQARAQPRRIAAEMLKITNDQPYASAMIESMRELSRQIIPKNRTSVSNQIAGVMLDKIKKR
jgi:lipid-A-disaccharide synthase